MAFDLNENNVKDYLVSVGLLDYGDVLSVETLGWGISNTLVKVLTPTRNMVVKQSLEYLRVKEVWKADRKRIYTERECISLLEQVLEPGSFPEIIYEDRSNFLFVMSSAPEGSINWKELLMSGEISSEMAEESGKLLKLFHSLDVKSLGSNELFNNLDSFIELRIDPYHRTVARLHSDVSNIVEREAERMLDTQVTLVHGDYSPKNLLVFKKKPFLIDFEVAHLGNPIFDLAFMVNHLFLKSIYNVPKRNDFFEAIRRFLQGYYSIVDLDYRRALPDGNFQEEADWNKGSPDGTILETNLIKQIGCLMLARIDGKSPVEYIISNDTKNFVRRLSKYLLLENYQSISEVINLFDLEMTRENKLTS